MTEPFDIERTCYIAFFGTGLVTGVYTMLQGAVRAGYDPNDVKAPPAGFNAPVIAAVLISFGAVGYLVATYTNLMTFPTLLAAAFAAAGGWIGMTLLMARWALKGPMIDPHEELEELQGTIATVTKPIALGAPGEISYVFRGQHLQTAARSLGGDVVGVGTDVVIERIDEGVADVELWSIVEQRL